MADDIFKWIRNVSALNDEQLKQEIDLVHQSSIKAFARALAKVRRPEVDTISTTIRQNISIGNTPCVIYTSFIIDF